jgi:CRISPR-associated protein Cas2
MTVVVTRDVEPRFRGFLASVMLEIAPGVYTSPRMTKGVRERVWEVMADWFRNLGGGCILMTWRDLDSAGGQAIRLLGEPPKTLVDVDGVLLVKRDLPRPDFTSLLLDS